MRQNIRTNPAEKLFDSFTDFSGGLNTETSNEKLKDNEFPVMENIDLSGRGSARRRTGRVDVITNYPYTNGVGQGVFFYYRKTQPEPDAMVAVSGRLYVKEVGATTLREVVIKNTDNTTFTFQATLPIEAVQYKGDLFVATGTKLVEVTYDSTKPDPWVAKVVAPYTPTVMEAIYIGTNGLADNPDAYVQDGQSTALQCAGIKPAKRTGAVNINMPMTAYINKPNTVTSVTYKWEIKKSSDSTWPATAYKDFAVDAKTWTLKFDTATYYDIRVTVKDNSGVQNPVTDQYVLTKFQVDPVDNTTALLPVTGIQRCRKIVLHWDRLLMSLDDTNPYQMYVSDLNNPRYFPVSNTVTFDTGKQESITAIIRHKNMLVVFTKTTVQTLVGKSVDDYSRNLINNDIGCISDRTARVVGNNIMFLSHEGVHVLKPNPFILDQMNVSRVDYPIKSEVPRSPDACAVVHNNQYWLCFPSSKVLYRLYYDNNMWVKDTSDTLNIAQFLQYGDDVYNLTSAGKLYKHSNSVFNDCGFVYTMSVESKYLDLEATFNYKKLKRLYMLAKHFADHTIDLNVRVHADSAIVLTPETTRVDVVGNEVVLVKTSVPNVEFRTGTTLGQWVLGVTPLGDVKLSVQKAAIRGKCRRVKVTFQHTQDADCEVFGFGLEYKLKKP